MSNSRSTKLHVAIFPCFAFGHITPYLQFSNKLAKRGHRVSFLLSKGAQAKVEHLNLYPNLIHFYPLLVPSVDRLPPGAEATSDVPFPLHGHLCIAIDQTLDQVQTVLSSLKPDFIFFDFSLWMPALAHQTGSKAIYYSVITPVAQALKVPSKQKPEDMTLEDFMQLPPGYPSSSVRIKSKDFETAQLKVVANDLGTGMSIYVRITSSMIWSDAMAFRTYHEVEGPYCDYLRKHYGKPVLLTGPVLPETPATKLLDEKWTNWLCNFKQGAVVYCAFGSQNKLQKDQFQELLLGFKLCRQPFLVALSTPDGCATIEEAFPEGFEVSVKGRGWVYGGWVPQTLILEHPSIGCSVTHCGYGSMWESLFSD